MIVIQADLYIEAPVVLVVPLTTSGEQSRPIRPQIDPDDANALLDASDAMVDRIMPVRRRNFGQHLGSLSAADLVRVERAMLTILGVMAAA